MSTSLLADAFGHHVWATTRLIDACLELTPGQLETVVPGTYGSILETMRHLVGADRSYLFVVGDGRLPEIEEAEMDMADLRAAMAAAGPGWAADARRGPRSRGDRHPPPRRRDRQPRTARDPPGPGAPSRHRPPQPDLHGAHDARDGAAGDRRVGLRGGGWPPDGDARRDLSRDRG